MNDEQISEVINKIITESGISKIEDLWLEKKKLLGNKKKSILDFLDDIVSLETIVKTNNGDEYNVIVGAVKSKSKIQIGITSHNNDTCIKDFTFGEFNQIIRDLKCRDLEKD